MFKELDIVKSKTDLSEKIKKGSQGTIVSAFYEPRRAYMVEFMENGITIDTPIVEEDNLELVLSWKYDIV